ncbi:hypothetical protein SCP_0202190 [Sparassis crispa]|uniref:DUF6729 domain-containing protein n=1 Tax=Sparassis crispa TaxID=139825 RepID=A0A401GA28_9APHY|nr:hypothetical protein SCP_0202190 [Sparassis crispa]GBE79022.1 hypothetical protein SCP_0202190 [Sparassis crispa]
MDFMTADAPAKRRPGRPKGSKNKPNAGTKGRPVGRPRKQPPVFGEPSGASDNFAGSAGINKYATCSPLASATPRISANPTRVQVEGEIQPLQTRTVSSSTPVTSQNAEVSTNTMDDIPTASQPSVHVHASDLYTTRASAFATTSASLHESEPFCTPRPTASSPILSGLTSLLAAAPALQGLTEPLPDVTIAQGFARSHGCRLRCSNSDSQLTDITRKTLNWAMKDLQHHAEHSRSVAPVSVTAEPTPTSSITQTLPAAVSPSVPLEAASMSGDASDDIFEREHDNIDSVLGLADESNDDLDARPLSGDDENVEDSDMTAGRPHKARAKTSLPTWLANDYKDVCQTLREEIVSAGKPVCYQAGQFMLCPKQPVFAAEASFQLSPAIFYSPQFFVWLLHLFHRIPCPACKVAGRLQKNSSLVFLRRLTWSNSPRRVVDLKYNIFIIGYRYYCGHPDCHKTYQSWSPDILNVLPAPLAQQFTFHLTYQNGLSDQVVALLRLCFQRGLGPVPFAETLRTMHVRHFDRLHLQYLEMVKLCMLAVKTGLLALHEEFGAWDDPKGYAGYVPSAKYLHSFYDMHIESHAPEMDQYTAMLPACVLSIDHSHKVPKHLGKVNGEAVFGALHTVVNEYGECRAINFTPTKAHDQFMPALSLIPHSLRKYGHTDVELVFTDNVHGDKAELERVFPSLSSQVSPVPSTSQTHLALPNLWTVVILSHTYQPIYT